VRSLVFASLSHYRGINALVIAGVAIAVAVLAGALLVGASVRASLRELALARLGETDVVVSSASSFREALAGEVSSPEISEVVALFSLQAAVLHEPSRRSAAKVNVFAIDDRFLTFHGRAAGAPQGRDAWISPGLVSELGAAVGDDIVLRIPRLTDIPLSHLQGRRDEVSERVRLTVSRVVGRSELGEFSLLPSQGPALSVFVPMARVQQDLDLKGRANVLLVKMAPPLRDVIADVRTALAPALQLGDLGLRLRPDPTGRFSILESRTGLLPEAVSESAAMRAADRGGTPIGVLTYLANAIRSNGREIPYSLIAAMDLGPDDARITAAPTTGSNPPIRLNRWAADDLGVAIGDQVDIDYFLWSDQAGLQTRTASFTFAGVVPMDGVGGDDTLTPEYPGITDAADVTTWDPPFPVDLKRVRKKDEEYWDRWRAAPKAFIPLVVGQRLWSSPYGTLSSLRTTPVPDWPPIPETDTGLAVRDVRREALAAASGTTDFGEYFVYFSFFLVVSALLLAGMFFALGAEQRAKELGLMLAVGFRHRDIRRILVSEAAVLAAIGAVAGTVGAVAYAAVIMYGLRTWWIGAVNTTSLELHVDPMVLMLGALAAIVSAVIALALVLRRVTRLSARDLLLGGLSAQISARRGIGRVIALVAAAAAAILSAMSMAGTLPAVAGFFGAGSLLMLAGCAAFAAWLRHPSTRSGGHPGLVSFGAAYARWRPSRSVLSAALIAFACFVIVAVAAFRRDAAGLSLARESGTGGYVLMTESVAPLMHNPNIASGRAELGLEGFDALDGSQITRFRLRPGDESSCLTLYQPKSPRLIAPEASFLDQHRFTFAQSLATTDEERANPWLLLNRQFEDGAVPAIADQTSLTYAFHLALGEDVVFAPEGSEPIRLRIVATLADSVLQSELIIGEHDFIRLFPAYEGYRVWMIEAPEAKAAALTTLLEDRLSDYGVDVTDTRARLAAYHEVENTYLSTFQALGALGLLLGTLGLAAVLARNVLERRRELGLLGAVGFTRANLRTLVAAESLLLVGTGVGVGTLAALVAIAPAILARASALPYGSLILLVAAVIATGLVASLAAVRFATSMNVVEAIKTE
jgi:ABC-type lipoprotein release transport system permease subunit